MILSEEFGRWRIWGLFMLHWEERRRGCCQILAEAPIQRTAKRTFSADNWRAVWGGGGCGRSVWVYIITLAVDPAAAVKRRMSVRRAHNWTQMILYMSDMSCPPACGCLFERVHATPFCTRSCGCAAWAHVSTQERTE